MGSNGGQLNDQECENNKFALKITWKTIKLGEEFVTGPVMNTKKQRFQPNEDEVLIQSWFNISKDSILELIKKEILFGKQSVNPISNTIRVRKT